MEPAVSTIIDQEDKKPWWRKKDGCLDTWIKGYSVKMELYAKCDQVTEDPRPRWKKEENKRLVFSLLLGDARKIKV